MNEFPLSQDEISLIAKNKENDSKQAVRDQKRLEKAKRKEMLKKTFSKESQNIAALNKIDQDKVDITPSVDEIQKDHQKNEIKFVEELESEDVSDEEKRVPCELEKIRQTIMNLENKSWRLIDARDGFNIYSNMKVQADQDVQMLKNSIRIVFSYIDVIASWNQGSGSSIVLSIFAAAVILCANDFSDFVRFYTHDEKHEYDP